MLKESILFVASTGLLIYFVTPSSEPSKPETVKEEIQKAATPTTQPADNAWDYDDAEEGEESFTFGEPTMDLDTDYDDGDDNAAIDEDDASARSTRSEESTSRTQSADRSNRSSFANSPASSELGSVDNPIVLKSRNPSDPADD
ncbi:hypothetical protein [Parasphingorhabdus sp.]|uniref:hypothetical protein n=1 Tax=Parasphingorhabdus sp. TaxID=2709688 RepID=UPI003A90E8CB